MEDLILALQIFMKYGNTQYPTHCEHDILMITNRITEEAVSDSDKDTLLKLGFEWNSEYECFASYRYGST